MDRGFGAAADGEHFLGHHGDAAGLSDELSGHRFPQVRRNGLVGEKLGGHRDSRERVLQVVREGKAEAPEDIEALLGNRLVDLGGRRGRAGSVVEQGHFAEIVAGFDAVDDPAPTGFEAGGDDDGAAFEQIHSVAGIAFGKDGRSGGDAPQEAGLLELEELLGEQRAERLRAGSGAAGSGCCRCWVHRGTLSSVLGGGSHAQVWARPKPLPRRVRSRNPPRLKLWKCCEPKCRTNGSRR